MKRSISIFYAIFFIALSAIAMEGEKTLPKISENMTKEEWQKIAQIGGAYLPIPDKLKPHIPRMEQLGNSLRQQFQNKPGYHSEEKQQIEYYICSKEAWESETAPLVEGMHKLAVDLTNNILHTLDIDEKIYNEGTGGLSQGEGRGFVKIAHYDSNKKVPGISWHKDIRFITILYINKRGLQGLVGEETINIEPLKDHFIVNLGVFFEAFVNDQKILRALTHQVCEQDSDRISFGYFAEGNYPSKGFYQLNKQEIVWHDPKDMDPFLIKDPNSLFSTKPHIIFEQRN